MTQAEIDAALDQIAIIGERVTLLESDLEGVASIEVDAVVYQDNGTIFKLYPREDNEGFYCHWWQHYPYNDDAEGTTNHHSTRSGAIVEGIDIILSQV